MLKCPNGHSGTFIDEAELIADMVHRVNADGSSAGTQMSLRGILIGRKYICDECGVRFVVREE